MKYIALDGPPILRGDPALVLLGIRALGGVFLYVMHTTVRDAYDGARRAPDTVAETHAAGALPSR
jgi:hypothetical protein